MRRNTMDWGRSGTLNRGAPFTLHFYIAGWQVIEMLGWFSPRIFLGPAQRNLLKRGLPVFAYHKLTTPPQGTRDPFLYVSPASGRLQLRSASRVAFGSRTSDA